MNNEDRQPQFEEERAHVLDPEHCCIHCHIGAEDSRFNNPCPGKPQGDDPEYDGPFA